MADQYIDTNQNLIQYTQLTQNIPTISTNTSVDRQQANPPPHRRDCASTCHIITINVGDMVVATRTIFFVVVKDRFRRILILRLLGQWLVC